MDCKIDIISRVFHFKQPAGASQGTYTTWKVQYFHLTAPEFPNWIGIGECAPLPNLSCDDLPDYKEVLTKICRQVENQGSKLDMEALCKYPSILFGLETAICHFFGGSWALWDIPFSRGEAGIPINGFTWMDGFNRMFAQIERKMEAGLRCIKLKIGAISFEEGLISSQHICPYYSSKGIELCIGANEVFLPTDVMEKLERLSELDLYSIEQPIRAGQWEEMVCLTSGSPLPTALDEELIGYNTWEEKQRLLSVIRLQYIIIKPSLYGGLADGEEWIAEAEKLNIGWWITFALESNIGLNTIAQWCATFQNPLSQGLGIGLPLTDNVEMPFEIRKDCLWFCK